MYSTVNSDAEAISTLSVKEMLGFIFIVSSSLYLLYPKGQIDKELSKNREENRQLSINYLQSMLSQNPHSIELGKRLIDKYFQNGELDKALSLTREFITKTEKSYELEALYKKEYLILKEQYFQTKNKDRNSTLSELNEKLYYLFLYAKNFKEYRFLLAEATSMDFKELRYKALMRLLQEESVTLKLKEDAVNFFISYKKMEDATSLLFNLVEHDLSQKRREEHFKVAFYILVQDKVKNRETIEKLIQLYREKSSLREEDLYLLSDAFLQIGQKKEAADFLYGNFKDHPELFTEKSSYEAIRILSYNSQLKRALEVSESLYKNYPSTKSLDSTIQLSTWLSKIDRAVELNIEGWRKYDDKKYETYLLEKTTFNSAYKVRGEIYRKAISNGDFSMVENLGEYFEYTGEIDNAEKYFNDLVKKYPKKSIYKEAIRFSHDNSNFKRVDLLYRAYREKFGIDKDIHKLLINEYIVTKQLKRAYLFSQELATLASKTQKRDAQSKKYIHKGREFRVNYSIILHQLAWMEQDYDYTYELLWREEKDFSKSKNSYAKLIDLELKLSKEPRLEYLYNRAWSVTHNQVFLRPLLSTYINKKKYKQFKALITLLNPKDRDILKREASFHILMANYYQGVLEYDHALNSFETALLLEPKSSEMHQSYLWFLLNNGYYAALKSEFERIKKDKVLQKEIAFPSVVAALKLDQADVAKKWLNPMMKQDKNNIEYQALYADILEFEGKKEEAKSIRFKLFKTMHREAERSKALLKDKAFAQLYLQLALSYKFPYSKKVHYMKKFKSLFSKEEYVKIELGLYSSYHRVDKVSELVDKHKLNYSWLNIYLATQRADKAFFKKAYEAKQTGLSLQDKITIAIESNHKDDAYMLLFKGMQDNQESLSLATTYWNLVSEAFPKSKFSLHRDHLSRDVTLNSLEFSSKYALSNNLNMGMNLLKEKFIHAKKENRDENSLGFSLSNHDSDFLWSVNFGRYFGDSDYYYSQFMLHYDFKDASVELNVGNNNKTYLTPKLQTYAVEESNRLAFTYNLSKRNQLGLSYTKSSYHLKEGGAYLGKGDIIQLSNTQLFRLGYPDITLFNHINIENFDFENKNMGLSSFTEVGSELTVGASAKHELRKSWRPYMSLGMALNDHRQLGSSLSVGAAGMLYQADKLDLSLRYIKGIDNLSEEYYGAYIDYSY